MKAGTVIFSALLVFVLTSGEPVGAVFNAPSAGIPILLYHRFGPIAADSMTVTTTVFKSQLQYLSSKGYVVISLRELIDSYRGKKTGLPANSVVLTADDGHISVYTDMFPLLKQYRVPATLFIYPSAISNATYATTWDQLKEMKETGLIDVQSHTFWHPNFKKEKERLNPSEYQHAVEMQLKKSKGKIERELNIRVDMLAWPFGIYTDELIDQALEAGYAATFTIERRHAQASDKIRCLPRYLMTHSDNGTFERILTNGFRR